MLHTLPHSSLLDNALVTFSTDYLNINDGV